MSKRTIQKYILLVRPPGTHGQSWATFLENHAGDIWACDFLQLYDAWLRPIFAFFIVDIASREVVHIGVTRSPSDAWVAQQLREATPWCEGAKLLIRDNDRKYGGQFNTVAQAADIEVMTIPPRSPNLNGVCERFLGSVRRECLDHVLILSEDHLRRVLEEYISAYFNVERPRQGIEQRVPGGGGAETDDEAELGGVLAMPVLGGLHHVYQRAASRRLIQGVTRTGRLFGDCGLTEWSRGRGNYEFTIDAKKVAESTCTGRNRTSHNPPVQSFRRTFSHETIHASIAENLFDEVLEVGAFYADGSFRGRQLGSPLRSMSFELVSLATMVESQTM